MLIFGPFEIISLTLLFDFFRYTELRRALERERTLQKELAVHQTRERGLDLKVHALESSAGAMGVVSRVGGVSRVNGVGRVNGNNSGLTVGTAHAALALAHTSRGSSRVVRHRALRNSGGGGGGGGGRYERTGGNGVRAGVPPPRVHVSRRGSVTIGGGGV